MNLHAFMGFFLHQLQLDEGKIYKSYNILEIKELHAGWMYECRAMQAHLCMHTLGQTHSIYIIRNMKPYENVNLKTI